MGDAFQLYGSDYESHIDGNFNKSCAMMDGTGQKEM